MSNDNLQIGDKVYVNERVFHSYGETAACTRGTVIGRTLWGLYKVKFIYVGEPRDFRDSELSLDRSPRRVEP